MVARVSPFAAIRSMVALLASACLISSGVGGLRWKGVDISGELLIKANI